MTLKEENARKRAAKALSQTAADFATADQFANTPDKPKMSDETKRKIAEIEKEFDDMRVAVQKSAMRFYP